MGAFTCVVATQDEVTKSWRLFALNKKGIAVFIEKPVVVSANGRD